MRYRRQGPTAGCIRDLYTEARGANLVEYIILVGVVALVALAGFRVFGASVLQKVTRDAACVAALDGSGCQGRSAWRSDSSTDAETTFRFSDEPPIGVSEVKNAKYIPIKGKPFVTGPGDKRDVDPNDVTQGQLNDCFVMSSLAEIALRRPEVLRNDIQANPDGTYTVTLYEKAPSSKASEPSYQPVKVTVTATFPSTDGKNPVFAQTGDRDKLGNRELWPALYEKALAQQKGSYAALDGGNGSVMTALTGQETWFAGGTTWTPDFDDIANRWDRGELLVTGTAHDTSRDLFQKNILVDSHLYYVTGVDRVNKTITVRNPWGWKQGETTVTFEQYARHFIYIAANPGSKDDPGPKKDP